MWARSGSAPWNNLLDNRQTQARSSDRDTTDTTTHLTRRKQPTGRKMRSNAGAMSNYKSAAALARRDIHFTPRPLQSSGS